MQEITGKEKIRPTTSNLVTFSKTLQDNFEKMKSHELLSESFLSKQSAKIIKRTFSSLSEQKKIESIKNEQNLREGENMPKSHFSNNVDLFNHYKEFLIQKKIDVPFKIIEGLVSPASINVEEIGVQLPAFGSGLLKMKANQKPIIKKKMTKKK